MTQFQPPAEGADQLLQIKNLKVHFPVRRGLILQRKVGDVKAVDDVSVTIRKGETLGLAGESGSGKTTVGRAIMQLVQPTAGEVLFDGVDVAKLGGEDLRRVRQRIGFVFQDPFGSLNPRKTAGNIIGEPIEIHKLHTDQRDYRSRISELLNIVGLNPSMASRYPHEFSGGQRQRIGIARALAARPEMLILDEPVSSLDVSIQAQIVNLLQELQEEFKLTYLFIAHDLSVVRHVSNHVAIMYLGKLAEVGPADKLFKDPLHPYTRALLSAIPIPDPEHEGVRERILLQGDIPSPANPPSGCVFHTRCPIAIDTCAQYVPELRAVEPAREVACIRSPQYGPIDEPAVEQSPVPAGV